MVSVTNEMPEAPSTLHMRDFFATSEVIISRTAFFAVQRPNEQRNVAGYI
jgi:hypothetical protein